MKPSKFQQVPLLEEGQELVDNPLGAVTSWDMLTGTPAQTARPTLPYILATQSPNPYLGEEPSATGPLSHSWGAEQS
ncbi:hypothetical protein D623_10021775 [Myotis brandtii]|uniref:Uncharacterized protein n=1 Tax=Myotis brandtii TaxID=109478 RepID=S7N8B6_MYOBR|nr:hypothetical protein D623_10021775 [Myotis brandtii]